MLCLLLISSNRVRMKYTSETIQGQVYIPVVNWILLIATLAVVGAFKSSTALANAYGFVISIPPRGAGLTRISDLPSQQS